MNDQGLTEINIYGDLADVIGQKQWLLEVSSVREAFRAIDVNCNRAFYKALLSAERRSARYKILVDEKEIDAPKKDDLELTVEDAINFSAALGIKRKIKKIEFVPVIEGGMGTELIIMGLLSLMAAATEGVIVGTLLFQTLVSVGIGLIMSGVAMLLAKPPDFGQFREIQQVNQKDSYLFNGPVNYLGEGGPVSVGYGRLIIGSLGIQINFFTEDKVSPIQGPSGLTSEITEIIYGQNQSDFGNVLVGLTVQNPTDRLSSEVRRVLR